MESSSHLKVLVSGAAGRISYSLLPLIAKGDAFGQRVSITLVMYDLPVSKESMRGIAMELEDCAFPTLRGVIYTDEPEKAFADIDVAVLVGSSPRKAGQERADLIATNARIFAQQGKLLDRFAKKTVKVLVVGNPANTNCLICSMNAPSIPTQNFTCLTMLDHNRLLHEVSEKGVLLCDKIQNVAIFGNHSSTMVPYLSQAKICVPDGDCIPLKSLITDEEWYAGEVVKKVRNRGGDLIAACKLSSAMSAAKAIADHLNCLFLGTKPGYWASMGVITDEPSYGVAKNIVFSFPVVCQNGNYDVVKDISLSEMELQMLQESEKELIMEKDVALQCLEK